MAAQGTTGQTDARVLLPGGGSSATYDVRRAVIESFIATRDWRSAYNHAAELHPTLEMLYQKACRPASSVLLMSYLAFPGLDLNMHHRARLRWFMSRWVHFYFAEGLPSTNQRDSRLKQSTCAKSLTSLRSVCQCHLAGCSITCACSAARQASPMIGLSHARLAKLAATLGDNEHALSHAKAAIAVRQCWAALGLEGLQWRQMWRLHAPYIFCDRTMSRLARCSLRVHASQAIMTVTPVHVCTWAGSMRTSGVLQNI